MDDHTEGLALAQRVSARIRAIGSAALPADLLDELAAVRRCDAGPYLHAFLDSVLARRDGRFVNRQYLALPVLELVLADSGLDPDRLAALLMADVIRHELRSAGDPTRPPRTCCASGSGTRGGSSRNAWARSPSRRARSTGCPTRRPPVPRTGSTTP